MLVKEGAENLWKQVDTNYVQPELEKRRFAGELPDDFRISQFRVLMPIGKDAIVEFNNEFGWVTKAKRGNGRDFITGTPVYLHEVGLIESVEPPRVDGERVAFIFFGWDGKQWQGCFDFSPNWPEEEKVAQEIEQDSNWAMNEYLTQFLQGRLDEKSAQICFANKDMLRKFGLWLVPVLIPYPLAQIVLHLNNNDHVAARELFLKHCHVGFLDELVSKWWVIEEFKSRRDLIEEALWAHQAQKFHLSVSTLLPHLEGIIVHWEFNEGMNSRFRTESRVRDFQNMTQGQKQSPFLYTSVHDSTIEFILTGPVLSTFQNWQDALDPAFPNRHAVGHGRYDPSLFTVETSIKVFLLLDTIKQLIAAQSK